MAQTRDANWIATQALTRIGEVSVDNPASPEDLALALDRAAVVQSDLQGRNIVYIADLDNTPAAIAHHVANALALALMPDFGYENPASNIPPQDVIDAALKLITSTGPQGFPMTTLGY